MNTKPEMVPPGLLLLMLILLPLLSIAQENQAVVPDGTQGEMLEDVKENTPKEHWRDKRWRLFSGKYSSLKFGLGFLYDYVNYYPDAASTLQMDTAGNVLEPTFDTRDFRVLISGKLTAKRNITWKTGIMYNGDTKEWLFRETGVMVEVPELWGNFFIGRTKEGFSLNKVMNGYAGWTMERQMAIDVIPILADGIKWMGFLPEKNVFWNLGIFTDWLSESHTFSTYAWQTAARVGWLPIYNPAAKTVLHVGVSYRYGQPKNGEISVRSKPEVSSAPYFIDTKKFNAYTSNHIGAEAYYSTGPWMFGTEIYSHLFKSPEAGNPVFYGGDVVASYMITGENRPYYTATSIFGFVPVSRPVFKGGPGAWEVLVRFSANNLNGGNLSGGTFWRLTPMINWYLSKELRLELAYGYGVLDRFEMQGATQFFQARIQITLL